MSTASVSPRPTVPTPLHHIPDVVFRSLQTALSLECRRRHGAEVAVTRFERTAVEEPMYLLITCSNQFRMGVQVEVSRVGGNVYDIHCNVAEGASRRYTYSLPGRGGTTLSRAPALGRTLGAFLLDELERQIGRRELRSQ